MDKLGVSAKYGLGVVMRQSFYAGNYSLTDMDMMPNPVSAFVIRSGMNQGVQTREQKFGLRGWWGRG